VASRRGATSSARSRCNETALGRISPGHAFDLVALGKSDLELGHAASALAPLERAVATDLVRPGRPWRGAEARFLLARALWESGGSRGRARALAEAARTEYAAAGAAYAAAGAGVANWLAARP
jgi:hypothetical protein